MMKNFARITLLSFWLFAIVAPSIVTLLDVDNPIVVTNLNEEEQQQESGKKSQAEEKMVSDHSSDFSLIAQSQKLIIGDFYQLGYNDYTSEIFLPPPEQVI